MGEANLLALARHVRDLAVDGRADELLEDARRENVELAIADAERLAAEELTPGAPVGAGTPPFATDALIDRGRAIYLQQCSACHGADGRGSTDLPLWNDDGTPGRPRDFTGGLLRGGVEREEILARILAGMPGTPMVATRFEDPEDAWALAEYVRSIIHPEEWRWSVQKRRELRARRVEAVPTRADDGRWDGERARWIPLMPLWWREDVQQGVFLRALHDGERLALHLTWHDRTRDDDPLAGRSAEPDSIAVAFAPLADDPPVFAMGAADRPVDLWQWKAWWRPEALELLELSTPHPLPHDLDPLGVPDARVDVPLWRVGGPFPGDADDPPVRQLAGRGPGRVRAHAEADPAVRLDARWEEGRWNVLFVRPLDAESGLAAGGATLISLALWDAARGDGGARKAVTIWHHLALD